MKNRYPLPLIGELMDYLASAKCFSKVNLKDAYHRIYMKESNQWKRFRLATVHLYPPPFLPYVHFHAETSLSLFCSISGSG